MKKRRVVLRNSMALLLSAVMASSLTPAVALADEGEESAGPSTVVAARAANTGEEVSVSNYNDLKAALGTSGTASIVKLTSDVTIPADKNLWVERDNVTLDLNGRTITAGHQCAICIDENVEGVVVQNGKLVGGSFSTVYMYDGKMGLTLKNVTVTSADGYGGIYDYGTGSTLNLENCNVSGDYFAIYHNGSTAPFTLNATGGTITGRAAIKKSACAIYVSGSSTNTSNGTNNNKINLTGCTVTGPTGIEGKYTDMTLVDCDIEGTATRSTFEQFNNGSTALGFAVVSTDNSMDPDDPEPEATITIDGGTYKGLVGLSQFESIGDYINFKEATYHITGGAFSEDPTGKYTNDVKYTQRGSDGLYRCAHSGTGKTVVGYDPATCGDDGYSGNTVCNVCKEVASGGYTIPATGEHTYGEWTVTKEATETEAGTQERACSVCNAKETQEVPALGHTPSAAWKSDASDHWKVCEGCGAELERAPHAYGEWTVTKEATEAEPGFRERSCSACGYVQAEEVAKLSPAASIPEGGSGWVETDDGTWGYVDAGEPVEEGWKEVGGEWYYFDDSAMQTGWKEVDGDWYYLNGAGEGTEGSMATGWKQDGDSWYYLEDTGKMATGWQEVEGEWYHLGDSGKMDTGWKQDGGEWYYLNGSGEGTEGAMATGWKKTGGKWYYLAGSGAMRSGWQRLAGVWYLLNASHDGTFGAMLEGWQRVDASAGKPTSANSWYYLEPGSGAMAANRWVGGYYVDASGLWVR
ncbi:hypothetical protein [Xiamenia xianingshaonis]|uniref:Uncharacterized protein n=1 Tax=Xiamenia xianingshaonis TaxID=2682776 RepID=A0ABX0IFD3_9ACTN|nr:hypothetical protein [Xiamenia xianingshaonis]NHM13489.1 hypothetical protein [Xiamenia xianingshaonis]